MSRWFIHNHGKYRQGESYRKNVAHKKKSKRLSPKDCWRIHRKIAKDKSNANYNYGGRRRSAVKYSVRMRRQFFRKIIHASLLDYDRCEEMGLGNVDYKKFTDRWMWD